MNELNLVVELIEADEHLGGCSCCDCLMYEMSRENEYIPASYYEAEARYYEELEAEIKLGLWD
jgi:hypothetical protein